MLHLLVEPRLWFNTFASPMINYMYMAYTTNPKLPALRMQVANLVLKKGWSTRQVARYTNYNQSTIVRWINRVKTSNQRIIATESSKPHTHPNTLDKEIVKRIFKLRQERNQCAEILHYRLTKEGIKVSLSSVKRTLKRQGLTKYSRWKKWHQYPERPLPEKPGILVQINTIFDGAIEDRLYIYTMLDVCSRWAYATPISRINTHNSWSFVKQARQTIPFTLETIQSDHGQEFSKWFTKQCSTNDLKHRHSRVRRPTDNAYVERFNRTIQEECLNHIPRRLSTYQKAIKEYLHYYNTERPHMGLDMKTPLEVMQSY